MTLRSDMTASLVEVVEAFNSFAASFTTRGLMLASISLALSIGGGVEGDAYPFIKTRCAWRSESTASLPPRLLFLLCGIPLASAIELLGMLVGPFFEMRKASVAMTSFRTLSSRSLKRAINAGATSWMNGGFKVAIRACSTFALHLLTFQLTSSSSSKPVSSSKSSSASNSSSSCSSSISSSSSSAKAGSYLRKRMDAEITSPKWAFRSVAHACKKFSIATRAASRTSSISVSRSPSDSASCSLCWSSSIWLSGDNTKGARVLRYGPNFCGTDLAMLP